MAGMKGLIKMRSLHLYLSFIIIVLVFIVTIIFFVSKWHRGKKEVENDVDDRPDKSTRAESQESFLKDQVKKKEDSLEEISEGDVGNTSQNQLVSENQVHKQPMIVHPILMTKKGNGFESEEPKQITDQERVQSKKQEQNSTYFLSMANHNKERNQQEVPFDTKSKSKKTIQSSTSGPVSKTNWVKQPHTSVSKKWGKSNENQPSTNRPVSKIHDNNQSLTCVSKKRPCVKQQLATHSSRSQDSNLQPFKENQETRVVQTQTDTAFKFVDRKSSENPLGVGLINYNNNCYANSLFQCMYHVKTLRDYFMNVTNNGRNPISNAIKGIFQKLDTKSKVPVSIKEELDVILEDKRNKSAVDRNQINCVLGLYSFVISAAIAEKYNVKFIDSIFYTNDHFKQIKKDAHCPLIDDLLLKRKEHPKIGYETCDYGLGIYFQLGKLDENRNFIGKNKKEFDKNDYHKDIESAFYDYVFNRYKEDHVVTETKKKMLFLLREELYDEKVQCRISRELLFEDQTFILRSFCVYIQGKTPHFYTMVLDGENLIKFNDSSVTSEKVDYMKDYGHIRALFYELDEGQV